MDAREIITGRLLRQGGMDAREIINQKRENEARTYLLEQREKERKEAREEKPRHQDHRNSHGYRPKLSAYSHREEVDESATSRKKSTALPREVPVTQIHPIRSIQAQPVQPGNTTLNATGTNATLGCMTPFSVEIMNNPNPGKIKVPLIDHFTGSTDPEDHLAAYKAQMSVQTGCETHLV